ncbi:MAG: hypothetical protein ACOC46_02295 [Pirellulales bacterium]
MIYRFTCECGAVFELDERVLGKHVTCTKCRHKAFIDGDHVQPVHYYQLTCDCGTTFRVEERAIGGTFRCPACHEAVRIDRDRLAERHDCQDHVSRSAKPAKIPVQFDG